MVYYKQRMKRLIIVSGINVYPSQVENAIDAHPDVLLSCAIGIPDPYKMHVVKAFVNEETITKMKKSAIFINTSLGQIMICIQRFWLQWG